MFIGTLKGGLFFTSSLVLWVALYFVMAYLKLYLTDAMNKASVNWCLLAIGVLGQCAILFATNFLGLRIAALDNKIFRWDTSCNPFIILIAISLLNLARNIHFENCAINYLSKLSLLIYIIHEYFLLRTYYRPLLWHRVYTHAGYDHVLAWMFILSAIVFVFGLIASIVYRATLQKIVTYVSGKLYLMLRRIYGKVEKMLMSIR